MPTYRPGKFAKPEILRQIRPDLLVTWLEPARGYLEKRGLPLPPGLPGPDAPAPLDCNRLVEILMDPTPDMPAGLVESLYVIEEMADEPGMDSILAAARQSGWALDLGESPTPADVAVKIWILDRALAEDLHNCQELKRPRSFRCYGTDARPLPAVAKPSPPQLARLEERLNAFYMAWKRGAGARVFFNEGDGCWRFLVRHGAPCRREPALDRGLPTTVFYRPQQHDVLMYEPHRGEMRINCCAERERRVLLRLFGGCLFGSNDFFPATARLTLAPLVWQGRRSLVCVDIPGLEQVSLTEVEFSSHRLPWKRVAHQARDIFELLERGELQWPQRIEDITRARFAVRFRGARRERSFTIIPSNRVVYSREDDSRLLGKWMVAREFMPAGASVAIN